MSQRPAVEIPDSEPQAVIQQVGRWAYQIDIHHDGLTTIEGWRAFGRRHAEKKARRVLARWHRRDERHRQRWVLTASGIKAKEKRR